MSKTPKTMKPTDSAEYSNLVNLLAIFTDLSNQMDQLQNRINEEMLSRLDDDKPEYASIQSELTETEAAIEASVRAHPEWFAQRKTIKTPYGSVKSTASTKLDIPNEEATIAKLQLAEAKDPTFVSSLYLRQIVELDREALEKLDDSRLRKLGVARVSTETIKIDPAKLDMGKAVKASTPKPEPIAA